MDADNPEESQPEELSSNEVDADDVRQRVDAIGDEYLESLRLGQPQNQDELVQMHEDLAPHLESRLKILEAVFRATHYSSGRSSTDPQNNDPNQVGEEPPPTLDSERDDLIIQLGNRPTSRETKDFRLHPGEAFRIRCPHCGNRVQLVDTDIQEVTCGSCGSAVHVESDATRTDEITSIPKTLGRFQVRRVLGQGSFGTVYLANDPQLSRQVALKVPRRGFFVSRSEEQRFFREAKSAARLRHPNIVQVHEISDDPDSPFIVSDFIDGLTLADVASGSVLSFSETVTFLAQIAEAVEYAHQNNIVHRDLKPGNILVDKDRNAFVADFGLARRDDLEITMTLDGVILGTPAYMSPEQASGSNGPVDARSDVYSLGVVLYRLLCRELPFHGTKRMLLHQVIHDEPKSPRRLNENIPKDLETITLKAMAKAPEARFQSAGEMGEELRRWLRGEPIKSRPISGATRTWRWCQRHPAIASLSAAIGLLLLIGIISTAIWATREQQLRTTADNNAAVATANKAESDRRLYRLSRQNGLVSLEQNDLTASAYWFSNALEMDDNELDRKRLGMIQDRVPKLVNLWQVDSPPSSIQFSSDGSRVAVGTRDGTVRVFDSLSGEALFEQKTEGLSVYDLNILPAGDKVVFRTSNNIVQIWDVDANVLINTLTHDDVVRSIDVNRDQQIVTGCLDAVVRIWDANNGNKIAETSFNGKPVYRTRFVSGTDRVAIETRDPAARKMAMQFWDLDKNQLVGNAIQYQRENTPFDVSEDGKNLIIATDQNFIRVVEIETGKELGNAIELPNKAAQIRFADVENELVIIDSNGDVCTWDLKEGKKTAANFRTNGEPYITAMDGDCQLLAVPDRNGLTKLFWRSTGVEACSSLRNGNQVSRVEFSPSGRKVAIGSRDGALQVWDLASSRPTVKVFQHEGKVENALFSNDGKRCITIGTEGLAYIWNVRTGQRIGQPLKHEEESGIYACAASQDGRLFATAGSDKSVRIWDALTGDPVGSPLVHGSPVVEVAFSPDAKRLVSGCLDGTVSCWNVRANVDPDQRPAFTVKHAAKIRRVVYNQAGDLIASASIDGFVRCWNAETGVRQFGPFRHGQRANYCDFLPDGKRLVTCGANNFVFVWDLATAEIEQRLNCNYEVRTVIASHDGRVLANDHRGASRVWRQQDGKFVLETKARNVAVAACNYSQIDRESSLLAACGGWLGLDQQKGNRGAAFLWDLEDDSPFSPPLYHFGDVFRVHFDPTGANLLTASADHAARLWSIEKNELPVVDARRIASLYAQMDEVEDHKVAMMESSKQMSEYAELSRKYPEWFSTSSEEIENWNDYLRRLRDAQTQLDQ